MSTGGALANRLSESRFTCTILFCLVVLACLIASTLLPRTWTASATLQLLDLGETGDPDQLSRLASRLDAAAPSGGGDAIELETGSDLLVVRMTSTSADRSLEQLSLALSRAFREEALDRRQAFARELAKLEEEGRLSGEQVEAAARALDAVRQVALAGESVTLPARITEMEARLASLASESSTHATARDELLGRRSELAQRMETLRADIERAPAYERTIAVQLAELSALRARGSADVARIEALEDAMSRADVELAALKAASQRASTLVDGELQPALERVDAALREADAKIGTLGGMLAAQQADIEAARRELDDLFKGNPDFLARQQALDEVSARDRDLRVRIQELRDRMVIGAPGARLPIHVQSGPSIPTQPDGPSSWLILGGALCAGFLAILLPLVLGNPRVFRASGGSSPTARRVSSAASQEQRAVRWDAVLAAILPAVTLAACALFVVVQ